MKCCDKMDDNLRKEIIMEHYMNPLNKETIEDSKYIKVNTNSPTCIDNIDLYVLFEDDIIKDIHFNGEACAISTSSSSIMTKLVKGKSIDEVKKLIDEYDNMIETGEEKEDLEEALAYSNIYLQQNRKSCATISWVGLKNAIKEYESKKDLQS